MKFAKIILGLVAAVTLLAGGFTAGSFITQTRAASVPVQQFVQPTFVPQQQFQPTAIPQAQTPSTTVPQTTSPVIPTQNQWRPGMWMMDSQGEWEQGWMTLAPGAHLPWRAVPGSAGVNPDYVPHGQQGWGMMHDGNSNNWNGMHGGMMGGYGWPTNPNLYTTPTAPSGSQSYPTPSSDVSFKDEVQPIFAARCVACHGGTNGLYLDTYENVMKGSMNGAVVIPGDVYNSRLAYYVYSGYMPFRNTPLTSTEIETILDWIALGAYNN